MRGEYVVDCAAQPHADPRHGMWLVSVDAKTNQAGRLTTPSRTSLEPTTIFSIDQKSATIPEIQRSQNDHACVRPGPSN
jgi:hypothetical protein